MDSSQKIGILVPGYNVGGTLADVLGRFSAGTLNRITSIVFIDNDSGDNTLEVARGIQGDGSLLGDRLTVIHNLRNHGLGGSLKIGLTYFCDNGFDAVMIIHSDKQGDSEEIAQNFLKHAAQAPDVDFIMASRFVRGAEISGYDRLRIIGNLFFNFLTFMMTGSRMSDSGCGIAYLRVPVLREVPFRHLRSDLFFNPLLNILLHEKKGLRIDEIPLRWKDAESASSLRVMNYVTGLAKLLFKYRVRRLTGRSGIDVSANPDPMEALTHEVFEPGK